LSIAYRSAGRYQEALAEAQKTYELFGDSPFYRGEIALNLAHLGKTEEAEKIIEEIKDGAKNTSVSLRIALTYSALKRKDETLKWLEYAHEAGAWGLLQINANPEFAWLRSDPRFQVLVRRIDPPPYSGDADR